VSRNVVLLTDPPRQRKTEREPFTPAEARALLAAVEADRLAAVYRVTVMLGLRRGEVLGLRWADINLDKGVLTVRRALQRIRRDQLDAGHIVVAEMRKTRRGAGATPAPAAPATVLVLKEPKTDRSRRTLALPSSLVTALLAHREAQAGEREAAGTRWREYDLVFTTPVGTAIDPDNLTKHWKAQLHAAGLRDQRFHDLRHAAATLMIRDGLPITEVAAILGHAQTSTTLNVYAHVLPGANQRAAEAMERLLG
jgi:integrase